MLQNKNITHIYLCKSALSILSSMHVAAYLKMEIFLLRNLGAEG